MRALKCMGNTSIFIQRMKTQLSNQELLAHYQSPDFVLKTQRQIAKDFGTSGIDFNKSFENEELSLTDLLQITNEKLEEVLKLGETTTLQLLYQIDIPQSDFLALTSDPDFIPKMSDLIIRREAYKVYLRSKF